MADEDDFDIDIYGDDKPPELAAEAAPKPSASSAPTKTDQTAPKAKDSNVKASHEPTKNAQHRDKTADETMGNADDSMTAEGDADSYDQTGYDGTNESVAHSEDGRRGSEPASSALKLRKISWWTTEDDIRGWFNQAGVEGELKEITFSEHKINGKSKEEAYIEFKSIEAAMTAKEYIGQKFAKEPPIKQVTAEFASSHRNPFKGNEAAPRPNANIRQQGYSSTGYNQGGYRGRGGFNRGGYGGQSRGGYNQNQMNTGGYGGMNNFGNMGFNRGGGNMMGMNRGGFQGNRGRGGMMGNMGMMPNMGMGMGGMGMGMGMMGMDMSSMMGGMGFGGFNQFNNNQQQQGNPQGGTGNPHGAKRPRPE